MKLRINKASKLYRANSRGGFAGISVGVAAAAAAGSVGAGIAAGVAATAGVLSIANTAYSLATKPSGGGGGGGGAVKISPDEAYFLNQSQLLAEYAAQKQTQDSTEAANYAYEQAQTAKAFFTYAAVLGAGVITYVILKKNKVL